MTIWCISDIHGHAEQLQRALAIVDLESNSDDRLILLGDYIDRGRESLDVLADIRKLQQEYPERIIALAGNHDRWMLDWLDGDDDELTWLMSDLDLVTVKSFLTPLELAHALGHEDPESDASMLDGPTMNRNIKNAVRDKHRDLIGWVRRLPLLFETDEYVFVHAGVDESAGGLWKAATPDHVLYEKFPATTGPMRIGKRIVAGHVRTEMLHGDPDKHGVFADDGHIYIDGSVEVTGRLNLLRINDDGSWSETSVG